MLTLRRSADRGHADHGWLQSHHSFSFAGYYDSKHLHWGNLRVINEDCIAPGTGFGIHAHQNMEIISYIIRGQLEHRDSLGNTDLIPADDIQRMSARSGVRHSEFNPQGKESTHLLQIWIAPNVHGITPEYEQRPFAQAKKSGMLQCIASNADAAESLHIHADASANAGWFDGERSAQLALQPNRKGHVHMVRGAEQVNGARPQAGDTALIVNTNRVHLDHGENAEVLVFDLCT